MRVSSLIERLGAPTMYTALPSSSVKSIPSANLPLHMANKRAPDFYTATFLYYSKRATHFLEFVV
jgi:hypothetical protein